MDFWSLLQKTQEYLSRNYAAALTDRDKSGQLKSYIEKFLRDNNYHVDGMEIKTLIDRLYCEMAEYSILTTFLGSPELEEINVNGWDDIALTYLDGSIRKLDEHFHSPQHAVDVIKRLLHHSGMVIDNATPIAQGHLPGNTRITALKAPIVDNERGVAVSIRLLHPQRVDINNLVETGFATEEKVAFLCMCIRYGVPFVVAGATSSGKTTFLNAIMSSIPDSKRVFTIESGSREFSLIYRDSENRIKNNIVNTLSRPSDNMEEKKSASANVSAFINEYAVPEMLIKLRQGVGRLIRCETDTGLISVLDTRAVRSRYSGRVQAVLSKYPRVENLDEIREFFHSVKSKEYFEG